MEERDSWVKEHLSSTMGFLVLHTGHCQFPGFQGISWNSPGLPLPAQVLEETKCMMMLKIKQLPQSVLQVPVGSYTLDAQNSTLGC